MIEKALLEEAIREIGNEDDHSENPIREIEQANTERACIAKMGDER